ncbi:response regulator [uncultured Desulfuromusa sp.]|uniref:response regulator n=1 Tax=uncultured Desulfuromusa sp. TaxID=219183 RepID=UPI002AA71747|nr:response regulator [uncultured Desulfuromusa sp.]
MLEKEGSAIGKRILFVDDEECLALLGAELLGDCGYSVTCEFNGELALQKFQQQEGGFDLVVTDESMPGMSGIKLAQSIFKISPSTPVILCSGHMLTMKEEGMETTNIVAVLKKTDVCRLLPETMEKFLCS